MRAVVIFFRLLFSFYIFCVYIHVAARGDCQKSLVASISFLRWGVSYWDGGSSEFVRIVCQQTPGIHFPLPLQCWDYWPGLLHSGVYGVLGIWTQLLILAQKDWIISTALPICPPRLEDIGDWLGKLKAVHIGGYHKVPGSTQWELSLSSWIFHPKSEQAGCNKWVNG